MAMRTQILILVAISATSPGLVSAQTGARDTVPARTLPSRCVVSAVPLRPVSDSAKGAAREIAGRAQAASIVGDNAAAAALYQQAAKLNPTDPGIAYALGRGYEASGDARAMTEYCRFLALSPSTPEAADVRQRIAELALALPPDTTVLRIPVSTAPRMPAPAAALVTGLIIPGMGQFMTHQPVGGVLTMAAAAAGIWYGLQTKDVTSQVTNTGTDPFGNPYQYQTTETHSERPNVAIGIGAAGALGLIAAIQAYAHAHIGRDAEKNQQAAASASTDSNLKLSAFPVFAFGQRSIGLGFTLR